MCRLLKHGTVVAVSNRDLESEGSNNRVAVLFNDVLLLTVARMSWSIEEISKAKIKSKVYEVVHASRRACKTHAKPLARFRPPLCLGPYHPPRVYFKVREVAMIHCAIITELELGGGSGLFLSPSEQVK